LNFNVTTAAKFSNYSLPVPKNNRNAEAAAVKILKNYFPHIHLSLVKLPTVCRDPETRVVVAHIPIMGIVPDRVAVAAKFQLSIFKAYHNTLNMNSYQKEQSETLAMVRRHLVTLSRPEIQQLETWIEDYVCFRDEVQIFLSTYFAKICDQKCYRSRLSACCSREGIITFFADVVINAILSRNEDLEALIAVLQEPHEGFKCIFLGPKGCLWQLKPIVCEMFLCDPAQKEAFAKNPEARKKWKDFRQREKSYRWPDRPVLFDKLEQYFIDAGYSSPLMYLHNSPGLLRVKRRAGLND
jgi:hypothetical protein